MIEHVPYTLRGRAIPDAPAPQAGDAAHVRLVRWIAIPIVPEGP